MKTETLFRLSNKIFGFLLLLLLLYEFNYSYGWGLNSMFPNIYFLKNEIGHKGFIFFIWSENGLIESLQVVTLLLTLYVLIKLTNNKIKKDNLGCFPSLRRSKRKSRWFSSVQNRNQGRNPQPVLAVW